MCILVAILGLIMFWLRNLRISLRFGYGACDVVTIWFRICFGYVLVAISLRFGYGLDLALDFCTLRLRFGDALGCKTTINCEMLQKRMNTIWLRNKRFGYVLVTKSLFVVAIWLQPNRSREQFG